MIFLNIAPFYCGYLFTWYAIYYSATKNILAQLSKKLEYVA